MKMALIPEGLTPKFCQFSWIKAEMSFLCSHLECFSSFLSPQCGGVQKPNAKVGIFVVKCMYLIVYLFKIPIYVSLSLVPSGINKSPILWPPMHPYIECCWRLQLLLITVYMGYLIFGTENWVSVFPKNKMTLGLIWPQHAFPLFLVHLRCDAA